MKNNFYLALFISFLITYQLAAQFSDCDKAFVLCSNDNQQIEVLHGPGEWNNEIPTSRCLENISFETNSTWIKWRMEKKGILEFDIKPLNNEDDIDFILFKLENWDDCFNREEIRCMASGKNIGLTASNDKRCQGPTGIKSSVKDKIEMKGCYGPDDNYLSGVDVMPNDMFLLVVNNCSSVSGFDISFGVKASIGLAPNDKIDNLFISDDQNNYFIIGNSSVNSNVFAYIKWDFGLDANPQTAIGSGPHIVSYSSSGDKNVSRERLYNSGCNDMNDLSLFVEKTKTSINTDLLISELFPNPSYLWDDVFYTIESKNPINLELEIIDVYGRIFKSLSLPHFEGTYKSKFSTNGLTKGSYFMKISDGEKFILRGFIVQ